MNQKVTANAVTFDAIGQAGTNAVISLLVPEAPSRVRLDGIELPREAFDYGDGLLRIRFPNRAETIHVTVDWRGSSVQ